MGPSGSLSAVRSSTSTWRTPAHSRLVSSPVSRSRAPTSRMRSPATGVACTASMIVCSPRPASMASGIPPRKPEGVVSQVLKSPWASSQTMAGSRPFFCRPAQGRVHDDADAAWHVLEGRLRCRLGGRTVDAGAGATVFAPARVPHTYEALPGSRYLIMLTPRQRRLIAELQENRDPGAQAGIYEKHRSRLLS